MFAIGSHFGVNAQVDVVTQPSTAQNHIGSPASSASTPAPASMWRPIRRSFPLGQETMDVLVWVPPDLEPNDAIAAIRGAQRWAEQMWLRFDARTEGRPLYRLAAEAGRAEVTLGPELFFVLAEAKRIALLSDGAYDPTAAKLAALWDLGDDQSAPAASRIQEEREKTAVSDLWLDAPTRRAGLAHAGQAIDIAPLASAYAMDGVSQYLKERGMTRHLIQLAGDVLTGEGPPGRAWRLGVQDPRAPGHFALWEVSSGAVMNTGDYFRFAFVEGRRVHNIVDPRSGQPARALRSVAVHAESALEAKLLSLAFFVLGPHEGPRLLERLQQARALWVDADNRVGMSPGVAEHLIQRPPTDAP